MSRIGKPFYKSDGQYLEKLQTPSESAQVSVKSERMDIILVLEKIIEWQLGDIGRLEHIYDALKRKTQLYKSDEKYLEETLESLYDDPKIGSELELLLLSKPNDALGKYYEKISGSPKKCTICNNELKFLEETLQRENKWFHVQCAPIIPHLEEIKEKPETPIESPIDEQIESPIEEQIKASAEKPIAKPSKKETIEKPTPTKQPAKVRPDPVLVGLAAVIFALLIFTAYAMFGYLSIIAITIAGGLVFYQLVSVKIFPREERSYGKRRFSVYSIFVMVLPFVFGTIIAFDGFINIMSITQAIFVWTLTISFWQTMLFVPLAIKSVQIESALKLPDTFPQMSILVPAYNEEKVIQLTIESLLNTVYPKKEIIVIDDGSTDRTLEIARQYKDQIKVLHKENGGKASALNHGLAFAKGDIVTIVDADTVLGRSALKNIAKGFTNENIAAVAGNIKIRNKVNWLTWCQALEYLSGIQIMRRALDYFGAITIVPGALGAFNKKRLVEAGTYHKATIVEDFDATMKILKSGVVVQASSKATAYTQAPQTFRDFYKQRTRWYRGNLQVMTRHTDILKNPRFGTLQRFAYPLMIIHMLLIPSASIMVWGFAIYEIIVGNYEFVAFIVGMFIILQYLLSLMAVRMDGDDKKIVFFSVFLVLGYKQIIDVLQFKAAIEELIRRKAVWTSAERVRS